MGISPIAQLLRYNGKDLESEQTVAELKILADDTLYCQVYEEAPIVVDDLILPNEGFGGTALTGRLCKSAKVASEYARSRRPACPQCTLLNELDATICEACQFVSARVRIALTI